MTRGEPRLYVPQLDGLRFCAFLSVFLIHATPAPIEDLLVGRPTTWLGWWGRVALSSGALGVDLFFVLSSYLITSLLVHEIDATGRIDIPAFWMRRVLRIWPLYLGFLAVYTVLGGMSLSTATAFALFVGNWAKAAGAHAGLADVLWSVSVEEQFYLLWPLVLAALPRRMLRVTSASLIVVAVVTRYALFAGGAGMFTSWMMTMSHLDAIGIGALVALAPRVRLTPGARGALGAASALAVVACAGWLWSGLLEPVAPGRIVIRSGCAGAASLALLGAAVGFGGILLATLAGSAWLSLAPIRYLGRVSYGLYVYHEVALWWVSDWSLGRLLVALAMTIAVAVVSYHLLEVPFLRMKARFEPVSFVSDLRHTPAPADVVPPLGAVTATRKL